MALLFGCQDEGRDPRGLERLLDSVGGTHLGPEPWVAGIAAGGACAAWGGDAHRGPDGVLAAITGFPRFRAPELAALARERGPAMALAEAYRRRGEALHEEVGDAFCLALIDTARRTVVLALDRIGQQHLFYARTGGGLVFGSRADALARHPEVGGEIDSQAIYDYLYCNHVPSPGCIYRGVRKLDGGETLVFKDGRIRLARYWMPEFREQPAASDAALAEELRAAVLAAVARLAAPAELAVGAFLSGGLDSSSVAGALARARPEAAPAFSIGFAVPGYDEMAYARIAAGHFGNRLHEHYLTPDDAVAAIPRVAAACDEPFAVSSALPAYFCARMARDHGIGLLLGGDGGDELFGGNERYARQMLFEPYGRWPGWLRGALDTGLGALPGALAERFPARKLARFVAQAKVPLPDRLQDYNFLHRIAPAQIFAPDFLAAIDTGAPLADHRACYHRPAEASAVNRMLYLDWKITLHDTDLVKVNRACELAGMPVAYPLLDDAVVDLSCRLPSRYKLRRGELRWFYKKAMAGFLPEAILKKTKHGFGLPFGVWLGDHAGLRELAEASIERLKQRPYFLPAFLDEALAMHRSGHAAYYGELIWYLMMLELWFAARSTPGGSANP